MAAYQNLIEIQYKLKILIWGYMVHLDIHHAHENSWCGSSAVSLPACMLWTLILFVICIIFHDYFPSTFMSCNDFWMWQYHFDNILLVMTVWEFWGKSGHEIKGKNEHNKADFASLLRLPSLFWFDALSPSGCILTSMAILDCAFLYSFIIPTNMTDNRCNTPAFHQINTATFSCTSISNRKKPG